jgi:hypothetical protein
MSKHVLKILSLIFFMCSAMLGHFDKLPAALLPYTEWIEFGALLGTALQAWRIQTANRDDVWTEAERARERARQRADEPTLLGR